MVKKVIINTDGNAEPNPGAATIGITIKDERGKLIESISRSIGLATNNQAEYTAIITALEQAIKLGATQVEARSDSELLVRQLNGQYRVKAVPLKPLYQKVRKLQSSLERFTIIHIPREENAEADGLARAALR